MCPFLLVRSFLSYPTEKVHVTLEILPPLSDSRRPSPVLIQSLDETGSGFPTVSCLCRVTQTLVLPVTGALGCGTPGLVWDVRRRDHVSVDEGPWVRVLSRPSVWSGGCGLDGRRRRPWTDGTETSEVRTGSPPSHTRLISLRFVDTNGEGDQTDKRALPGLFKSLY